VPTAIMNSPTQEADLTETHNAPHRRLRTGQVPYRQPAQPGRTQDAAGPDMHPAALPPTATVAPAKLPRTADIVVIGGGPAGFPVAHAIAPFVAAYLVQGSSWTRC